MMARRTLCLAALGVVPLVSALTGCIVAGPASIAAGRGVYNEGINRTEDEQLLNMIVRERYNETYGLLAVASVTANIRASANVGAQFGLTRTSKEDYDGNLVPLAGGVAYEENPTISYIPLRDELFVQRLLAPLSVEEVVLMARFLPRRDELYLSVAISSINGIRNPLVSENDTKSGTFLRVVHLWRHLNRVGVSHLARDPNGGFEVVINVDDTEHEKVLVELLELMGISKRPSDGRLVLPFRLATATSDEAFNIRNRSVLEILRTASACIEVPESHLEAGVVEPLVDKHQGRFMRIRTSRFRPDGAGAVAVRYRGWWYYVDDADPASKQAFHFLRTLVGLRLYASGKGQGSPVLTIPVG